MDNKLKLKLMENRRRIEEEYMKDRARWRPRQTGIDPIRKKADPGVDGDKFTESFKAGNKRKAPAFSAPARISRRKTEEFLSKWWASARTYEPGKTFWNENGARIVFLFEFALGYALFDAHGLDKLPGHSPPFEMAERYINSNPFTLVAFYPFSSPADALLQMNAILKSFVTKELQSFLVNNLPKPGNRCYQLGVSDPQLGHNILCSTGIPIVGGYLFADVMRGLREKIDKFCMGFNSQDLKKAQLNLARCYRRQSLVCRQSSMLQRIYHTVIASDKVVVVPHKFDGLFIVKVLGKKDFICTKNLVPGKVLYGDKLISVQNEDDRTEVEYRIWNPRISKLAAAILGGLTNIWVKPGSRVLYMGEDICGITVLQLSDLVGSDGLVYVRGLSDDVANMVEERSNVVTITKSGMVDFRVVVGMVDVILGNIVYHKINDGYFQVYNIAFNTRSYLRTGGHYLISTQPKNINVTGQFKDPFVDHNILSFDTQRQFKSTELVMLEAMGRGHVMAVGGFRMA